VQRSTRAASRPNSQSRHCPHERGREAPAGSVVGDRWLLRMLRRRRRPAHLVVQLLGCTVFRRDSGRWLARSSDSDPAVKIHEEATCSSSSHRGIIIPGIRCHLRCAMHGPIALG
jgi:hypothetical protein